MKAIEAASTENDRNEPEKEKPTDNNEKNTASTNLGILAQQCTVADGGMATDIYCPACREEIFGTYLPVQLERGDDMEAICKPDFEIREKAHNDAAKAVEDAQKKGLPTKGIIVPAIGYHDIYGVWFFGSLKEIVRQIGSEKFGVELGKQMHIFTDVEPKKIKEGIHDISVYGNSCRLYKWMAQGYHRGLVVLADDEAGNKDAEVYRLSGTWSWKLKI